MRIDKPQFCAFEERLRGVREQVRKDPDFYRRLGRRYAEGAAPMAEDFRDYGQWNNFSNFSLSRS
jgi:hypothetical protein